MDFGTKKIGKNIEGSDSVFEEIRQLEVEKAIIDKKKSTLRTKLHQVRRNTKSLENKLEKIKSELTRYESKVDDRPGS